MTEPSTPLMRQYTAIKKQHPTALLFFRLGDFYELFFEDAVVAARELQITLTSRNKEKDIAIPMCGVPYHSAENYLSKLRSEEHTSELQSRQYLVCRLLLEKTNICSTRAATPGRGLRPATSRSRP